MTEKFELRFEFFVYFESKLPNHEFLYKKSRLIRGPEMPTEFLHRRIRSIWELIPLDKVMETDLLWLERKTSTPLIQSNFSSNLCLFWSFQNDYLIQRLQISSCKTFVFRGRCSHSVYSTFFDPKRSDWTHSYLRTKTAWNLLLRAKLQRNFM